LIKMSSFTERATWTENPFVFQTQEELPSGVPIEVDAVPLHKALYDKLVKLVIPSPKSKTDPWSDKGRREWRPGYDPVTKLDPTTVAPGLIEGMPLQSRRRKEPQGEGGKATFLNLIVDVSGSMASPMNGGQSFGYYDGLPLGGEDLARVVTPLMIRMAKQNGDKFQVVRFGSHANIDWPGPATDYDDAIAYYTNSSTGSDSARPLAGTESSTNTEAGLRLTRMEMERYLEQENLEVKSAVTIVISDGAFNYGSCVGGGYPHSPDGWLRQYGPVFYVFIAPDEGSMDGNVLGLQTQLKAAYGSTIGCKHCVVSFAPKVGQGGNVSDFAGSLVEMCQANAGEQVECGHFNE
jgi:hypothetical protein